VLVFAVISPHPPIIVPEIGQGEEKHTRRTINALEQAALDLAAAEPDELIVIAPHEGHGFEVPLYYLGKHLPADIPVHQELVTEPSYEYYYRFGLQVGALIAGSRTRYALIASGDLSHVLKPDGPYGFDPAGPKLDKAVLAAVRAGDAQALLGLDPQLLENGAECGLRSILFLLGAIEQSGLSLGPVVYEGPFGVGYLTAVYQTPASPEITRLARRSIEHFLRSGKMLAKPRSLPDALTVKAAAFVSLHEPGGQLRGCIGTTHPTKATLAGEVIANAVAAATADARFHAVTLSELDGLQVSVDVLTKPEPVQDRAALDPDVDGVIVTAPDGRQGVLLPDLDGVDTVEQQVAIARGKAGIGPHERIKLQSFRVQRFSESTSEPARTPAGTGPAS
jgi:AmmeMemoRadiSam system protein A